MTQSSSPSAPEAGELARRIYEAWQADERFLSYGSPQAYFWAQLAAQAVVLKLAETEKRLAEADAWIAWKADPHPTSWRGGQVLTEWREQAIARHALRSAATSGKGDKDAV